MSVLTRIGVEIDRIETAKASIKAAIEGKGVTVPSGTKIDGMSVYIDAIDTSENLDPVLTEQESIIDQIQAALEGKAGVSGPSVETCQFTIVDNSSEVGNSYMWYTDGDVTIQRGDYYAMGSSATYEVLKNTIVYIGTTYSVTVDEGNAELLLLGYTTPAVIVYGDCTISVNE